MIFKGIEARLAFAASLLAVVAVAGTAAAIREGARREFFRVNIAESHGAPAVTAARVHAVGSALSHRCCPLSGTDATHLLDMNEMALVFDASSRLLARIERVSEPISTFEAKRTPVGVVVTARVTNRAASRDIHLQLQIPAVPVVLKDGNPGSLFLFRFPTSDADERTSAFLQVFDRQVLAISALVAVLVVILMWMTARLLFHPLRELGRAMSDLSHGDLTRRVPEMGGGEITALQKRFNVMATELGKQQLLRRAFMSDVAHELRTPLTAVRCRLEAIVDGLMDRTPGALEALRDDLLHLGNLVDDLQQLSLADAGEVRLERVSTPVEQILLSAIRAAGLEGDSRLRAEVPAGIAMFADAIRIRQVITNLLTNAGRHTPSQGSIIVRCFPHPERVVFEVYNSGSTLEADQPQRVFERFYRADPARQRSTGGSGLGLAIVKSLVEAHGGRVWAAVQADGVTFGFEIPRASGVSNLG